MRNIAVIGLGYVGLPVAVSFAKHGYKVIGFDIDKSRISELSQGFDKTREVEGHELADSKIHFSFNQDDLKQADFFIVTVPTPIDDANRPDIAILKAASRSVGAALKKGDIVVYESTVYPGATEDDCVPILEKVSGLKFNQDFFVGYSPERINPGDKLHRFETIKKVVSGSNPETLKIVAKTYGSVVTAGIHQAPSIKVAEAAKVIENTQRDVNIAFVNELALIFQKIGIDTLDVLEAAGTKWNFLPFRPGLVGGHCIGVDPYYLSYQAERHGLNTEIILSGRRTNNAVGAHIAKECIRFLLKSGKKAKRVTVLGLTFKEDVPDIRNSKVIDIIRELQDFGVEVQVLDAYADAKEVKHEYGVKLTALENVKPADAVILAVQHDVYKTQGWTLAKSLLNDAAGLVMDVKGYLDRSQTPANVHLWRQ